MGYLGNQPAAGIIDGGNVKDGSITNADLAAGVAVANLGYTPVNKAGDTISGVLGCTGLQAIRQDSIHEGGQIDFQSHTGAFDAMIDRYDGHMRYYMSGAYTHRFSTQGVDRLIVDGTGSVTLPYQPAAHIGANVSYNPTNGTNIKAVYTDVKLNRGNHYNSATGDFTCPSSGVYRVTTSIHSQPSYQPRHFIAKNGGFYIGTTSYGSDWHNGGTTALIPCAAGDTISLVAFGIGNTYLHGDASWGGWNIEFVG